MLANRLGVSDRTLRRDITCLRELGYEVQAIKGPDGGYRLNAGSELPPLLFDDDQAVALAVALQVFATAGLTHDDDALRALATVRQLMPSRLRNRIDGMAFSTMPNEALSASGVESQVLVAVSTATRVREVLRFDYESLGMAGTSELSPKRVEPHHLVFGGSRWYLVAWDLDVDDWRIFRVDRVTPRTPTGPRFTPRSLPDPNVHEFLARSFKGADSRDTWPCKGTVVLPLPAKRIVPFVPEGSVETLGPEQVRVTLGSWSWVALASMFARFDAPMTDVTPPELVEAFAVLSERFEQASRRSAETI